MSQRLLRGFFQHEVAGIKDALVDRRLTELAAEGFHSRRPLYRLLSGGRLEVHPDWAQYLKANLAVVRGWAAWEWAGYMAKCNPHTPAVSEKLFVPEVRDSLTTQRKFWTPLVATGQFRCLYSGALLDEKNYVLDHFLPWKFVLHDRLWNLTPALSSINSSKGDSLPSRDYLTKLVELQCRGLSIAAETHSTRSFKKMTECFVADLGVEESDLWPRPTERTERELARAYRSVLPPLLTLAGQLGFSRDWRPSSSDQPF